MYREREMFYLTTHSTHFIYGYMASDIWLRTILIVRKETRCRPIGYSYRLTARVLLYAPSHRQDNTYHGLCYTSRGALAGTRNSSMGSPHEGSIRWPIASWANTLTTELHLAPIPWWSMCVKSFCWTEVFSRHVQWWPESLASHHRSHINNTNLWDMLVCSKLRTTTTHIPGPTPCNQDMCRTWPFICISVDVQRPECLTRVTTSAK